MRYTEPDEKEPRKFPVLLVVVIIVTVLLFVTFDYYAPYINKLIDWIF
jgi:hypothetical protein